MRLHVLASGSKGNAAIVEDEASGSALLIDCGICKRDFFLRCEQAGIDPARIEGVVITHEHTDHTKGLGVVYRGLAKQGISMPLYVSEAVYRASEEIAGIEGMCEIRRLDASTMLPFSRFGVHAFATSHDAAESFGFRIEDAQGDAIGYMTDTGIVTDQAYDLLEGCRVLALEGNHDEKMLEDGPYPYFLKQRVASERGHLSNVQSKEALTTLASGKLEQVIAMHVSENNNTYRLACESLEAVLAEMGHGAKAQVAYQHMLVSV